ncbi:uncharacterized protein LOC121391875 [Gigantopelta aegis]|uniref:uncharacterized protein LOC121391875 n=1 Tax=Gigantopelta aegis TaxID=1735272 RepID=UPI001B889A61|nr:uncharacterized protein LOC121391875 [Gigantopelta aegis]
MGVFETLVVYGHVKLVIYLSIYLCRIKLTHSSILTLAQRRLGSAQMFVMYGPLWFVVIVINLVTGELIIRHGDFRLRTCTSDTLSRLQTVRRFDDVSTLVTCGVYCTREYTCSAFVYHELKKHCQLYEERQNKIDTAVDNITHGASCWVRMKTALSNKEMKQNARNVRIHDYSSPKLVKIIRVVDNGSLFGSIITFPVGQVRYLVTYGRQKQNKLFRIKWSGEETLSWKSLTVDYWASDMARLTNSQTVTTVSFNGAVIIIDVFPFFKINRTINPSGRFRRIDVFSEQLVVLADVRKVFLLNLTSEEPSTAFRPGNSIDGLAISPDGNLLLAHPTGVALYNMSGAVIWQYETARVILFVRFDGMGNIILVNDKDKSMELISGKGEFLKTILKRNSKWNYKPSYITFDEEGDLYMSDKKSNLIYIFHFQ